MPGCAILLSKYELWKGWCVVNRKVVKSAMDKNKEENKVRLGKNLKDFKLWVMTMLMLLAMSAVALAALPSQEDYPVDDDTYVYRVGYGEPDQSFTSGIRAAQLDAYRLCVEAAAAELETDSERDMGYMSRDVVNARVKRLVHGLALLKQGQDKETGIYYAVVRLPRYGATNSLAKAVFDPSKAGTSSFAMPQAKVIDVKPGSQESVAQSVGTVMREGNFTGVIIDCRGMNLKRTMSPVIKDERGESIYGYKNLDYDKVISIGMAGYTSSLSENVSRAGARPLVLRAVRVDTRMSQNHVDPVISNKDADKLLAENAATGFLRNCAVVFVR